MTVQQPTYVGIGAQKCASTWLHRILAEHPEVVVPEEKEIDFFSVHYERGFDWYCKLFDYEPHTRAAGEISPSYFCDPYAPARVREHLPEARIILSLRDPLERVMSNHRHEVRVKHLRGERLTLESGLRADPMYIEQSLYAKHLQRWLDVFPREQLLVVLMDDIRRDPLAVAAEVYDFVGVDRGYVPDGLTQAFNRSFATRSGALARVKDRVYALSRQPGFGWIWRILTGVGLRSLYRGVNKLDSDTVIPEPRPETLAELRAVLEPDIRNLEALLGRDLSEWLK